MTMITDIITRTIARWSKMYHVKVLALIIALINYSNNIRHRTYLSWLTILPPSAALWHHLLHNGDASSFLLMKGLTREAWVMLHDILRAIYHCQEGGDVSGHCHQRGNWDCSSFTSAAQWIISICVWFLELLSMHVPACWEICWSWQLITCAFIPWLELNFHPSKKCKRSHWW